MTPELARKLADSTVNPAIYEILKPVFDQHSGTDIAAVVAKIRAERELANLGVENIKYGDASVNKSIENHSQGPEKKPRRRAASKTNTTQDN